jgi:DNA-binding IclR family transcriptional regulator
VFSLVLTADCIQHKIRERADGRIRPTIGEGRKRGVSAMGRSLVSRRPGRKASKVVVDPGPSLPSIVKSAGRVLQIFDFFDEIQRAAKVHEISERLNFPQSSTSVLLKCLTQLGYMDYDSASRTFLPSPRVALLGSWMDNGPVRDGRLVHMMEDLSHKTGDTVILAARNGIYADYMRVIQSPAPTHFRVPQGSRRLVVWSATGFALLCHERNELIQALCLRANAEAADGKQSVQLKRAFENIQQVREKGYFFSKGLVTEGAGSIAMPLSSKIDQRDRPFALAVSGPLDELGRREKDIVAMMDETIKAYLSPSHAVH